MLFGDSMNSTFGLKKEVLRKLVHLSATVAIFADLFFTQYTIIVVGTILCIAYLTSEYFRFKGERIAFITDMIKFFARPHELKGWVLTPFYPLASITILYGLAGIVFSTDAVHIGILALTFGDASAAIIGRKFGRHRHWIIRGKSLEGSISFFLTTFIGSLFFVSWQTAVVVALGGAIIEIFSGNFDNFTVPFCVAILVSII